ncbi:PD-(D/E)XK nuclease family protein [Cardinium endosymbiont of Oedothorax gibbosus]|uniref:PD-(D/E)XK nuclease family protein n=1 Tax=Cardinium endosymbiont of Oedothorax gibbosus TaxID=931101 RepID=UPI00202555A1|nr:PD-(D/E)XK nuclease family protein [Cardinium endosymbiont of Oedothorax gibbosus]CAH2559976.1 P-loop NTPase / PD-(D/E)XK endonuclease-like, AddAB-type domain-containing protein [Cardinium endosymbiont of Oedothorax gibbosus]
MKTITHPPFLAEVISHVNKSNSVGKCLFIFPNQLSIDYFQSLCNKERWQDSCVTLHQLMLTHSRIAPLPTLALLSRLHRLAEHILNRKESFEQFYGWGFTLLQDFNTIDNHLVNGAELFASLMEQKQLTSDAFVSQKASALPLLQPKEALLFWKQLPLLYQSFRKKLIGEGKGYEGLCYSMAQPLPEIMAQELIFVGFNLLTPAQEQFIRQFQAVVLTTFFWDVDSHYLDNAVNLAGHYLRQHREKKWFQKNFVPGTYFNDPHKKVFLREASTMVAQVQAVVAALQEKTDDGKPKFLPCQTAIVVSGSDLLIPLLDHLSNLPISLHCRLDYPFSATVVYTLVARLVALWEAFIAEREEIYRYMADVLALWYPFAEAAVQSQLTAIRQSLDERKVYHVFDLWLHQEGMLPYLQEGVTYIYNHCITSDHLFLELNKTALYHVLVYIKELRAEMATCSASCFLNGLKQSRMLFHKANPVTGLYIVEVSESYNLDFEHVFFLNMNEGCFPKVTYNDSFLPYDLCYSFGLPLADKVAENKTAYGFYRLLQRAQNVYGYYAPKNHLEASNEMSRLLLQLTFDSKLKMIPSYHSMQLLERTIATIAIQKDHAVMQLLDRFLVKEAVAAASITPAALISYLSCPLQFYFSYLLQLKQTALPKDGAEAVQLGILFHDVMARLYQPFIGMQIDTSVVVQLQSKIKTKIEEAIAAWRTAPGMPILLRALLEKLLTAMLDIDGADAPFTLLGVEVAIKQPMVLDAQRKVWLSGVIDRIDRQNHLIRIIDYKTGLSNCKISSIATLFDPTKIKKNRAIFQLFFYAWLFQSLHGADDPQLIMPYLIHIQEIFLKDYRPGIFIQQPDNGKKYQRIKDMMAHAQPFEEGLKELLVEIFNPVIPFVQTEDLEICAYCPYVRICQRD